MGIMEKNEKVLYIIAGANGSGKSTLAKTLLAERQLEFLNADEIAKEIAPNAINSVPITAGKEYFKRLYCFFELNKSFAVESTLSGNNIIKIIDRAKEQNYKVIIAYSFLQNCTACIERVKIRVENGGHNVPKEDIVRRYYKSVVNFWDKYRFIADEWSIFYNGCEYTPMIVSYGIQDSFNVINQEIQDKFYNEYKIAKEKNS